MPSPGMQFGRYELREALGAGGMGEVFRAYDRELHRDVAIKFLPERFASDPERLARFTHEARAASSLNHPNILTIHDIGQTQGLPYIVMEWVDGQTLRHLMQEWPLPQKRTLDIAVQLADGLAKAHAAGIVHRDLKPENVMVTKDGVVKIVDFGLAVPTRGNGEARTELHVMRGEADTVAGTVTGPILGTVGYMAPEQARGHPVDHRSDQFALGAILYELATGRRAFHRDTVVQTIADIIETDPAPIATVNPAFPAPARWLIERCLAKDAADRYASTLDLARELRGVRDHLSETSTAPLPPSRRRRPRPWQIALFLAVVVLGVVLGPMLVSHVHDWFSRVALPEEMRVAVLPVPAAAGTEEASNGLADYVVGRLADLSGVNSHLSVIPASEIAVAGVKSPSAASRSLGATISVDIRINRVADEFRVTITLSDAKQVLRFQSKTLAASSFSPDQIAELVLGLLEVQLAERDKTAWRRGAPAVGEAGVLLAQALGQTPYSQARGALERYDQEQRLKQAINLFNKAVDVDPRYAAAYAGLGEAYLRLFRFTRNVEDFRLAAQAVSKARALDDSRPGVWMLLGMLRNEEGNFGEAEKAFHEAVTRNPGSGDLYRELGSMYQRMRQPDKAEAAFRKAIELQPHAWANHNSLGALFLVELNRYQDAEKEFRAALEVAPDNARVLSNLGALYLRQRRYEQAETTLKQAIQNNATGAAISNLGALQYERHQFRAAAETYERGVTVSPRDGRIWQNLGGAYHQAGEAERATTAYERAAALYEEERTIDPRNPETAMYLAECYAMLGRAAAARSTVEQALTWKPAARQLRTAAEVYEDIGDRNAALQQIRAALAAGLPVAEFESGTAFERLRKDPRYAAAVKAASRKE